MGNTAHTETDRDTRGRTLSELLQGTPPIAMVMTMIGREHSARPVTVADVIGDRLSFLVARHSEWAAAIAGREAIVHVTVADDANSVYVSLNGTAIVVVDEAEKARLWTPAAKVWFDGPDDPELAVLHFDATAGHFWDGPGGRLGRVVALARAAISGDGDDLGTSGPVDVDSHLPDQQGA